VIDILAFSKMVSYTIPVETSLADIRMASVEHNTIHFHI
jgi:hypothetical protein